MIQASAPERPHWIQGPRVGSSEGEATRADAIEAARIAAAMAIVEERSGVLLASVYEERSTWTTGEGDREEIRDALRLEASSFVRIRKAETHAERVRRDCGEARWRAWARVQVDVDALSAAMRDWLKRRGVKPR